MQTLLKVAAAIDRISEALAGLARWALLADALLVAGNALSRKFLGLAAPVLFDLQWHFFAAVVLLTAAHALKRDEHVRIDVFAERLGPRALAWIDAFGLFAVVVPLCIAMIWLSWPQFVVSFVSGETRATRESVSQLPAWVIKGLIPLGFATLGLQAFAEAIRRIQSLRVGLPLTAETGSSGAKA